MTLMLRSLKVLALITPCFAVVAASACSGSVRDFGVSAGASSVGMGGAGGGNASGGTGEGHDSGGAGGQSGGGHFGGEIGEAGGIGNVGAAGESGAAGQNAGAGGTSGDGGASGEGGGSGEGNTADLGAACGADQDCSGQYCVNRVCADHCSSGVRESDETDKDCGGETCSKCADGNHCNEGTDCKSLICVNEACQAATCSDGTKNQDESDTDCGGACAAAAKACDVGLRCNGPGDCQSWICSTGGKCTADTVIVGANDIIDDFEDGDFSPSPINGRVGNWYVYGDSTGITTQNVFAIKRGTSIKGLRTSGKEFENWGSGLGVDINHGGADKLPWDASAYRGVTFWARAEAAVGVTVMFPDIDTDGLTTGRTCTTCNHHYFKSLLLSTSWQRYTVDFADLSLEPGDVPVPTAFKPAKLSSLLFQFGPGQSYDVYLDDVAFVKP